MTQGKLVLLKPRSLRRADWIIPALTLLVGPILRELLGSQYSAYYGFVGLAFVVLASNGLIYRLATRHGGKWVSRSQRYRLLAEEAKAASPWPIALMTATAVAILFLALMLILLPFDQFGTLPLVALGVVAVASAISGSLAWFEQRRLSRAIDEPIPQIGLLLWLGSFLPALYLASVIADAAAIVAELTLEEPAPGVAFTITYVVLLTVLFQILFRSGMPQTNVPALNLKDWLIVGVALWGVPMAMLSASRAILRFLAMGPVRYLVLTSVVAVIIGLLSGLGVGAWMYWARRFYDPPRNQAL